MKMTTRADINIGYSCNIKCKFCYYQQTVTDKQIDKDLSVEIIKRQLKYIHSTGLDTVDFTGGEPTVRKELFELVRYAKSIGFKSVALITNGLKLDNSEYVDKCIEAGIDDFLLSIHGHNAAIHDYLTNRKGAFDKVVAAIENVSRTSAKLRINCVVNGVNYRHVPDILALAHSLSCQTVNLIMFNPIVEADWRSAPELNVAYSDAAPVIKNAIDAYKDKIAKITVRYMPFCLMQGYEQYVTNNAQLQYDPDEWDYLVRTRIRKGPLLAGIAVVGGVLLNPAKKRLLTQGFHDFVRESIQVALARKNKRYSPQCYRCKYKPICDGLWRKYVEWRGTNELVAVKGKRIYDPGYYMREHG
ncbi:MAG: radical SAM protein [Deltaproteobacteria bacterium]|nr:radical SAM protein [Deltaproteobacteria bacterium]